MKIRRWRNFWDSNRRERIGVNVFDRIHPDDLKFARDMFNRLQLIRLPRI